jgi:hypothetical protein
MSTEKDLVVDKMNEILSVVGLLKTLSIDHINHKPHRYTIGPKHVGYAADHEGGMMTNETLKKVQCAFPRCSASYEEHISNKVAFLQLNRDGNNDEANDELKKLADIMKEQNIEGIVMVESDPEYRIT